MKNHDNNHPQASVYLPLGVPPGQKLRFRPGVGHSVLRQLERCASIRRSVDRRDFR